MPVDPVAHERQREVARPLDRDAVGDRRRGRGLDRAGPRPATAGRRRSLGLHADDLDVRPRDLHGIATPASRPPPPQARPRPTPGPAPVEQLEAERALAGDDVGVVERVDERQAALGGALARGGDAGVDGLAAGDHASPRARVASTLRAARSTGMKTSHGTPALAAARATALAWLPALPRRRRLRSAPSAASFAGAPRILNDPVRCRFSALSTTDRRPRARRASTRPAPRAPDDGVDDRPDPRDVGAVTPRAAHQPDSATMASISTFGAPRQRGDPDRHAGGGLPGKYSRVGLVDLPEGPHVGDVDRAAARRRPASAPAAAQTAARFSRQRPRLPPAAPRPARPVAGSSGICPEQNSSPPAATAWEYGPSAAGAPGARLSRGDGTRGSMRVPPRSDPSGSLGSQCEGRDRPIPSLAMFCRRLCAPPLVLLALAALPASAPLRRRSARPVRAGGVSAAPRSRSRSTAAARSPARSASPPPRLPASAATAEAVIALAGGPGQAATPFAADFARSL